MVRSGRGMVVNQYGRQAMRYWQENLPRAHGGIADPERFFGELGEQIGQRVEELTRQVAGPDQPGEGYMAKLGRLQMARVEAETEAMRELLPQPEQEPPGGGDAAAG